MYGKSRGRLIAVLATASAVVAYASAASATANHLTAMWDGQTLTGSNTTPGSRVTVTSPHGSGTLCSTVASGAGTFACRVTAAQAGGDKILHLQQSGHAETVVVHLAGNDDEGTASKSGSDEREGTDNDGSDTDGSSTKSSDNESSGNESSGNEGVSRESGDGEGSDRSNGVNRFVLTSLPGLGSGATCPATLNEGRAAATDVAARTFSAETALYASDFGRRSDEWQAISGTWHVAEGALTQTDHCGFDYTAILSGASVPAVADFRYTARFHAVEGGNQGGIVFDQSSPATRSLATLVDLANGGTVVRWGHYDRAGYYVNEGSAPIAPVGDHAVTLSVESHGGTASITVNGQHVGDVTNTHATGGLVGLVASQSQVAFESVTLTGLPAAH